MTARDTLNFKPLLASKEPPWPRPHMSMAEFLRQDPEVLKAIYEEAMRQADIEQQNVIDAAKQLKESKT